jgi:hypothetical protein
MFSSHIDESSRDAHPSHLFPPQYHNTCLWKKSSAMVRGHPPNATLSGCHHWEVLEVAITQQHHPEVSENTPLHSAIPAVSELCR